LLPLILLSVKQEAHKKFDGLLLLVPVVALSIQAPCSALQLGPVEAQTKSASESVNAPQTNVNNDD
jgi:hypothetical protein